MEEADKIVDKYFLSYKEVPLIIQGFYLSPILAES